jgi:hypothetical protein
MYLSGHFRQFGLPGEVLPHVVDRFGDALEIDVLLCLHFLMNLMGQK